MGVLVKSRTYNNQFKGSSEDTNWLIGNVGDWQKLDIGIEAEISFYGNLTETITIDTNTDTITLNNGKSWGDYGFDIGFSLSIRYTLGEDTTGDGKIDTYTSQSFYGTVGNIVNSIMFVTGVPLPNGQTSATLPYDRGTEKVESLIVYSDEDFEGLNIQYNQLANEDADSASMLSLIDGSVTAFNYAGLDSLSLDTTVPMDVQGLSSGSAVQKAEITKHSPIYQTGKPDKRVYTISIFYMIGFFYNDYSDFEDNEVPEKIAEQGSLTDNYYIRAYPKYNNPNVIIQNDLQLSKRLGNTGWFDENFNALKNDFVVDSVAYTDTNNDVISFLDYKNPTNVSIVVSGIQNLSVDSEFIFGFAYTPISADDYSNNKNTYQDNFFVNTGRVYTDGLNDSFNAGENTGSTSFDGFGKDGAFVSYSATSGILFTQIDTDKVLLQATITPNSAFTSLMESKDEDDRNYLLWISTADHTEQINFSNRVSLIADKNSFDTSVVSAGEYPDMTNVFLEHGETINDAGVLFYDGFIEDDVLCKVNFTTQDSNEASISNMKFYHIVRNEVTGVEYVLDTFTADLTTFPIVNGVQEISFDSTRGYFLPSDSNKNIVKVERDSANDTATDKAYIAYFANRIRWEDWIAREDVPDEYYDNSLENNGQSNNWLNYLRALPDNHSVYFRVNTNVNELGVDYSYDNYFQIDFNGYDENTNIDKSFEYYRNAGNQLLSSPTVLQGENTRVEVTFTNNASDFTVANVYIEFRLYDPNGAGALQAHNLSSIGDANPNSALRPLDGETGVKLEFPATNVVKGICLIDSSYMPNLENYVVTARLGDLDNATVCPNPSGIGAMRVGIDFCVS